MSLFHVLAAMTLVVVGVAHSVLGEAAIIRPLLADSNWSVGIARSTVDRIIRFAWHLTTIAWIALAATALGMDGVVALLVVSVVSGGVVVVLLPSHLAWPLFLLAGLWAGVASGVLGRTALTNVTLATATVAAAASLLHVAWLAGLAPEAARAALPTSHDGDGVLRAGRLATATVAAALATFAAALTVLALEPTSLPARVLVGGAAFVLAARAIGDGRYVGFTKRIRGTPFSRRDDRVFTPIVVVLALGAFAGLAA